MTRCSVRGCKTCSLSPGALCGCSCLRYSGRRLGFAAAAGVAGAGIEFAGDLVTGGADTGTGCDAVSEVVM